MLVLPAHNEAPRIGAVLRARAGRWSPAIRCVVIVVDDGSTDDTAAVARGGGRRGGRPSRATAASARRCAPAWPRPCAHDPAAVAFCDADGEYAPEELDRDGGADPRRAGPTTWWARASPATSAACCPHRRAGNRALTVALSWVARRPITDGQSGYRALAPWAAADAEIVHDYNYAQVLTLDLLAKGARYTEVPIPTASGSRAAASCASGATCAASSRRSTASSTGRE